MTTPLPADKSNYYAIEAAKAALQADLYARFDEQEPRLRAWLQGLPILELVFAILHRMC